MKPERMLAALAFFLLLAGYVTWAFGGTEALRSVGIWLFLAAAGVLFVPLALALLYVLVENIIKALRRPR